MLDRPSRRKLSLAVAALAVLVVAGCGGGDNDDVAAPQPSSPVVEDPGPVHVHGLGVNPKDGALFIATHTGLFRSEAGSRPRRVAGRYQDTMGFTVVGPDRFLGSGHPDGREKLPPFLGLIRTTDAGGNWKPVSLLGKRDFHVLEAAEVGERYLRHLAALGRKRSTLMVYESVVRVHLVPFFDGLVLDKIGQTHLEAFIAEKQEQGGAPKSIRNYLGLLHSIFGFAERRGWTRGNPCKFVELPEAAQADADIRFLDQAELEALVREMPDDGLGATDRVLYLTAAMIGLRQGELLALRWRDIDWKAGRIRVRQSYVRGEFGTPKSKRSTRSVPLADRLAGELERLFQRSAWQADDDLVFPHPDTGRPLERSRLLKRFKASLTRARVREVRFHDLRHTFGTRMAAAGVPLRTLQEWMGHRDFKTTLIYADYQPSPHEAAYVEKAFDAMEPGTFAAEL